MEIKKRDKRSNSISLNLKKNKINSKLIKDYEENQKSFLFKV